MAVANKFVCVHAFAAHAGLHKTLADLLLEINNMPEIDLCEPDSNVVLSFIRLGEDLLVGKQSVIDGLQALIADHSSVATFREVLEDEMTPPYVAAEDDAEADDDEDDEDLDDEEDDDFEDDDEEEEDDDVEDDDWEEVDDEDDEDLDDEDDDEDLDDDDDDWDDDDDEEDEEDDTAE